MKEMKHRSYQVIQHMDIRIKGRIIEGVDEFGEKEFFFTLRADRLIKGKWTELVPESSQSAKYRTRLEATIDMDIAGNRAANSVSDRLAKMCEKADAERGIH